MSVLLQQTDLYPLKSTPHIWHCTPLTSSDIIWKRRMRIKINAAEPEILSPYFSVPLTLLPCLEDCTLPTMQRDHTQSGRRSGCVLLIEANGASSCSPAAETRSRRQSTPSDFIFSFFLTCSLQPQMTQVTSFKQKYFKFSCITQHPHWWQGGFMVKRV